MPRGNPCVGFRADKLSHQFVYHASDRIRFDAIHARDAGQNSSHTNHVAEVFFPAPRKLCKNGLNTLL